MKKMKLFAGLDMHQETTTGTIKDSAGNPIRKLKLETKPEGIKLIFGGLRNKKIKAVFEASSNWFHYANLLKPYCSEVCMAHPAKIKAIAFAKVKTDSIDSEVLCDLLRADLIPYSYMPGKDIMQLREILRFRATISNMLSRAITKIKQITCKGRMQIRV